MFDYRCSHNYYRPFFQFGEFISITVTCLVLRWELIFVTVTVPRLVMDSFPLQLQLPVPLPSSPPSHPGVSGWVGWGGWGGVWSDGAEVRSDFGSSRGRGAGGPGGAVAKTGQWPSRGSGQVGAGGRGHSIYYIDSLSLG